MRNPVSFDGKESRAISTEIGERLGKTMGLDRTIPRSLEALLERLRSAEPEQPD